MNSGTVTCDGLIAAIAHDFAMATAKCEMHFLGLFGKLFTGPWMTKFYTSAASTTSHMDGIGIAKAAITALNSATVDPCGLLERSTDFIGGTLELTNDATLQALVQPPGDTVRFGEMMAAVMTATNTVLERQYKKYVPLTSQSYWRKTHDGLAPTTSMLGK